MSEDFRFRALFEHSSDPHLIFGADGVTDCNEAAVRILGAATREQVLRLHPAELSPELQPDGSNSREKAEQMDAIARDRGFHRFEWWHQRLDGKAIPVEVTLNPITTDDGELMVVVWHDLSEIKRRESELRSLNERLVTANERMHRDLVAAADVQRSLLPHDRERHGPCRFAWQYEPSTQVGGDFLDIVPIDERHSLAYVLDVTGHGVPASLLSVTISHLLERDPVTQRIELGETPLEIVKALNARFSNLAREVRMFTVVCVLVDHERHELRYVHAGHPPAWRLSAAGEASPLEGARGMPVGVTAEARYEEGVIGLAPGDRIVLLSDGILETRDASGEIFGDARFKASLERHAGRDEKGLLQSVVEDTRAFAGGRRGHDDVSMLVIAYGG